jgi:DNA-binding transcriptional LysR family regulator
VPVRSESLAVVPVFKDPLVWIAGSDTPLAKRKKVTLAELAEEDLILHRMGSLRRLLEKQLRPFTPQLRVTMELTSAEMVKKFVAAGMGASMISELFVKEEVKERKITILQTDSESRYRELGLVYHEGRSLSRPAQAFVNMATEMLATTLNS